MSILAPFWNKSCKKMNFFCLFSEKTFLLNLLYVSVGFSDLSFFVQFPIFLHAEKNDTNFKKCFNFQRPWSEQFVLLAQ